MGRFNATKYNPKLDSTPGVLQVEGALTLSVPEDNSCPCGCRQAPKGKDRVFCMGHDARLRGKLIRAFLADVKVATVTDDVDRDPKLQTAMAAAKRFGWEGYLEQAADREKDRTNARAERSNKAILAKATGPQIGDMKLIKVGRWEHTGQVIGIWDDGEEVEFQFTTKSGARKTVRKSKAEAAAFADVK